MRILVALLGLMMSLVACADDKAPGAAKTYQEGKEYTVLEQPVRTADANKIEAAEVFSYHCPHCFHFEPLLQAWAAKQPADVYLTQTHANWAPMMEPLMRGYYTSVVLHIKDKTHQAVFNAFHMQHNMMQKPEDWADLFANYGIPKEKTLSTYNSFGVDSLMKQAEARARSYKITGTPEMVIDGRYHISSNLPGGQEEMLQVADFLIAKVRAERAAQLVAPKP